MQSGKTPRRILIAAECFADADAALRFVDLVLDASPAEVSGLLVDDDIWTNTVRFPEQRVVTLQGAMIDPPSSQKVRFLRESDARAFQKRLATVAHSRSVKWSFERRPGDLIQSVVEVAETWDILFLGYRVLHKRPGQVILITGSSREDSRAHQFADELARMFGTAVSTLSLSDVAKDTEKPKDHHFTFDSEQQLLSQLSRINAACVVLDISSGFFRTTDQLRRALDAARCPVVVFGANTGLEKREASR